MRAIVHVPHLYRLHAQFVNCTAYLAHHEWQLAHNSLIELAHETGYCFSDDFWLEMANAADAMQLTADALYCRQQLIKEFKSV